jgi:hypothetical protein
VTHRTECTGGAAATNLPAARAPGAEAALEPERGRSERYPACSGRWRSPPGAHLVKSNRSLAALAVVVVLLAAFAVRWEEWDYEDGRGGTVFQYRGLLLPWQEAQAPPAGAAVATVSVHKRTALGFNRYDYAGPPGAVSLAGDTALRAPGR